MSAKRFSVIALILVLSALLFSIPTQAANAATCAQYHYVQYGQNLFRISLWYGTTVAELQRINGLGYSTQIYAGSSLCVSMNYNDGGSTGSRWYTVQWGDTLSGIARYFGVNLYTLAQVNNIYNVNAIYAGQTLAIPS